MAVKSRFMAKPVGSGTAFIDYKDTDMVLVYKPVLQESGHMVIDTTGGAVIQRVGGVKAGSKGTIVGPSLKVPRKALIEYKDTPTAMGLDLIDVYPVEFDDYAGIGYLPGDAIKII